MKRVSLFLLAVLLVVTIILFSWFSEGKIVANGSEENWNIFHSQKSAEYATSFWRPVGTGFKGSFLMATYPTFAVLGKLENLGVPTFARQILLLGSLMTIGIFSTFLLLRLGFKLENTVAVIGGFFYSLNIYAMTQIWKRYVYSHMFAWAYLPLFIFLWIKWINTKRILWLLIFLISSLFFTLTFSNPVFLLTLWTPAFIFVLLQLLDYRKQKKQFINILLSSFVGLFLWIFINLWWLYPTLTLGSTWTTQTGQTWQSDLSSLHAVSKYFPIWEIVLLRQSWYLGHENDWFNFYHNPLIYFISLGVLFITIRGFIKSRQFTYWKYLTSVAIVGLFISKGTSYPFGYTFFEILFSKVSLTVALRNSYEKFGMVWLLPYAVFFAIGFNGLFPNLNKIQRYIAKGVIVLLSMGLLILPMWNGDIFPERQRLNIPNYYIEANNYLKNQNVVDSRVFSIPSSTELERIRYSWGFYGVDPSDNLFEMEVVSIPKIPGFFPFYELLQKHLYEDESDKLLGFLGVENIIFHRDNIYPEIDIVDTQNKIEKWKNIKSKKDIGQLTIYTLNENIVKPRVYVATSLVTTSSIEEGIKSILDGKIDINDFVFTTDKTINLNTQNSVKPAIKLQKISHTKYKIDVSGAKGPFILVLNNTFDYSWEVTVNKEIINTHFIVNGFANGWILSKEGDYSVEINLTVWPWEKTNPIF